MSARIHIVVDDREREAFRSRAAAEGLSLSEWLREAARERLDRSALPTLREPAALMAFFGECDDREEGSAEPDWDTHLSVITASRRDGLPTT